MSGRPLRILYAAPAYKPAYRVGGPILSVAAAAESLVKQGHQVTVFTSNSNLDQDLDVPLDQPVDVDGVEVWYFRRRELLPRTSRLSYFAKSMGFLYAPAMQAELDRLVPQVDAVHTQLPFVYPTLAAARTAFRHHRPLYYHQRGVFDPARLRFRSLKKTLYIRAVERPIMSRATCLIALTHAEVDSYRALKVTTPCEVIPNGIAVGGYRTAPRASAVELGIDPDSTVVLFMGRLHPIKGAEQLLEAFIRVARDLPKAVLVMAGPDEWSIQEKMSAQIHERGLAGRVLFPGMVTGDNKLDLLARADLFCLPSVAEGFSMAVLEALASGTAVLLSPGCHFGDVEARGAGTICEPNADSLARSLRALLVDRARLGAMGARGRALVDAEYRWESITERLLRVYYAGIEHARPRM